jgi:hypothetical protein
MKTNGKYEPAARTIQRGLMSVVVLAMPLIAVGVSRAQLPPARDLATAAKSVTTPESGASAIVAKAASPTSKAWARSAKRPPTKGALEGITAHGYWIIDIRNPDGRLVKHLEFENQLCTTFSDPAEGGESTVQGGDSTLSSLLLGKASPGAWSIILGTPETTTSGQPAPNCAIVPLFFLTQSGVRSGNGGLDGGGFNVPAAMICDLHTLAGVYGAGSLGCIEGLAVTSLGGGPGVTLSQQFTVPTNSTPVTISAVGTDLFTCSGNPGPPTPTDCMQINRDLESLLGTPKDPCHEVDGPTTSWVGCVPSTNQVFITTYAVALYSGRAPFSGVVLTGTNGIPGPQAVLPGQSIAITWSLSFQ